ncbi:RidA family protein [Phenylobacterium hankyongense]|uniref:RidA family protein n=1 Tax=Phenylobacterium hankyongense TaxID=1813876 RepID=A0A328AXT7_9CAUL|nr:RidA family protein [Phenylobacterium hankyongense]RAK58404.1 RidA family protein [Phenylobacterium hankyongense]
MSTPPVQAPPLSKSRRAGDLLFLSGQLPRGADGQIVEGDVAVQTRQALSNLVAVLEANGGTTADVVKVTAWLTDRRHYKAFNDVYCEIFSAPFPARSVVVCDLVADADVEIEATAYIARS